MARGLGRLPFLVNALNGEAESLLELGRYFEAKELADEALAIAGKGNASLRLGLGISLRILARLRFAEGNRAEALDLAKRGEEVLAKAGDKVELEKIHDIIKALEKARE